MASESENIQTLNTSIPARNISSITIYEYMYGDDISYAIYYSALVLILVVGPVLCLTIVLYEHYGGDRQKRTIINRLASLIFTNIALQSCIWSILRIMRDMFGLLPTNMTTVAAMFAVTVQISSLFFVTELTIFRFLYIVVWRRMKTIEDDFWNFVLTVSTALVSVYYVLAFYICGDKNYDMGYITDITEYEEQRYIITFNF